MDKRFIFYHVKMLLALISNIILNIILDMIPNIFWMLFKVLTEKSFSKMSKAFADFMYVQIQI
jgi:hypothetical protein